MKNMKNIIKILFVLMAFTIVSCEKYLVREPITTTSTELTLSDFDGLSNSTLGAYSPLYNSSWYGAGMLISSDIKANNAKSSPISSGRYQTTYSWQQDPANTSGLWTNAYQTITYACNVLDKLETFEPVAGVATQADLDHLKAECLFLRALAHFDLVKMFAQPYTYQPSGLGVPIVLKTEIASPARNTTSEVYAQIISDLNAAKPLFEANFNQQKRTSLVDVKGVASADAADALLARVYLYMGDYAQAATYATNVINSGRYSLYTAENYGSVWGTDAASEVIFEIWGNSQQTNAPYWEEIGYMYSPTGYGDVCATQDLLDLLASEPGDVRANLFLEGPANPGYFWTTKYPGKNGDRRQNNIPVLRLSEMYLIRAEARLKTSGDALGDLNMIRTNRGLAPAVLITENDIFNERRKELCFEGHILYDYARLNKSLTRVDEDGRITENKDVPFPSYLWAMPIPRGEMEANPNMVQNDNY